MSDFTQDEADKLEAMKSDTKKQEKNWTSEFAAAGPAAVQRYIDNGAYPQGHAKTLLAMRWLKEQK